MHDQISRLRTLFAFIKLTRPVFLLGGVMQYGLGIAMASAHGVAISLTQAMIGQFLVSAIQLMAQYANEYFDVDGDLLNARGRTLFSGGSGVLPSGRIKPEVAFYASRVCAAIAIFLTAFTVLRNPLVSAIATLAILGGWFYSAPPFSLMRSGWGELSASLIVALLVPSVGYIFQTQRLDPFIILVCLPLILVHWAMIIAFELPDLEADIAIGKRTQTVRLGLRGTFILHTVLLLGVLTNIMVLTMTVTPHAHYLWLAIPLIIWQGFFYGVSSKDQSNRRRFNLLTMGAVGLFSLTTALWLAGFVTANIP